MDEIIDLINYGSLTTMDIILITEHFPPEIGSASSLFFELGCKLNTMGYYVRVITTFPRAYNLNKKDESYSGFFAIENIEGMEIFRVKCLPIPKDNLLLRGVEQFWDSMILALMGLYLRKSDIILVYSPPLPLALAACILSKIKRNKVIVNVQDLYPHSIIELGLLRNKYLISIFKFIEQKVYKYSDFITVHSLNNKKFLINQGASPEKVKVIYNWVDTAFMSPSRRLDRFKDISLTDKFVISYAGVLSIAQGLDVVLEAAKLLNKNKEIVFLIAGDGFEKNNLLLKAVQLQLNNLIFLPFQPKQKYKELLSSSDASIVCLRPDIKTPVVPGKLMSIMASGCPVIASVPLGNDTAEIIREANCGLVVEAGNAEKLAAGILSIYSDAERKKLGKNGMLYAQKFFSLEGAAACYVDIFNNGCGRKMKENKVSIR